MKKFLLNRNFSVCITLFSIPHIALIIFSLIIVLLVIYKRNNIRKLNDKTKKLIRISFGVLLLVNFIIRRGSFIYFNVYDWHIHLDINFCNFTSIMFIIYSFTGNKKILNICYHMAFIGPLLSIVLPSYNLLPFSYSFYSFIIMHHIVFIFSILLIFMENIKWHKKLLFEAIEFLIIYYIIIFTFDYTFGLNYNMPLTFVNSSITIIKYLADNTLVIYTLYFCIITCLLLFGNQILKVLTKNKSE